VSTTPAALPPAEAWPEAAAAVFGDRSELARRYADLLVTVGIPRGLLGPREAARIWTRHLLNGAALADAVPQGASVLDVGSGAGLPGIPLALARPDLEVILLESMARRVAFLDEVVQALDLPITVRRGRVEDVDGGLADVVVTRALAPLARLLTMVEPVIRRPGLLLALKGDGAEAEVALARPALSRLGAEHIAIVEVGPPSATSRAVRVEFAARSRHNAGGAGQRRSAGGAGQRRNHGGGPLGKGRRG
jgi:16S rRNA (guanine527-N7)-methyltransferase